MTTKPDLIPEPDQQLVLRLTWNREGIPAHPDASSLAWWIAKNLSGGPLGDVKVEVLNQVGEVAFVTYKPEQGDPF